MTSHKHTRMTPEMAEARIARLQTLNVAGLRREWVYLFGTQPYTSRNRTFLIKRLTWRINTLVNGGISERAQRRAEEIADETLIRLKARRFNVIPAETVDASPKPSSEETPQARLACTTPAKEMTPGTVIRREYKGKTYEVTVLNGGKFAYDGVCYNDLTSIAWIICGYPKSGNAFFNLPSTPRRKRTPKTPQ